MTNYDVFFDECCGEKELSFLTIEHRFKDGNSGKSPDGKEHLYQWLKRKNFPQNLGLEVLCWNCNSGRWMNDGKCPHDAL